MSIKTQRLIAEIRRLAGPTPPPPPPPPPPVTSSPAASTPATVAPEGQTSLPATPTIPVPANTNKSNTSSKPATPTSSTTTATSLITVQKTIKAMQEAIQSFASTVTHHHTKRSPQTGRFTSISTKSTSPTESESFSDFNDFITLNYLNSSSIRGNEWSTDEGANTAGEKNPVYDDKLIQMRNVVDNMIRIGSGGSERDPDGRWSWRTQNALRDIYAFGDALIRLSEDFSTLTQAADIFTASNLQNMREQIPTNDQLKSMKSDDKLSRAKKLTLLITRLTKFYYYFANTVIKHPAYRRFTDKLEYARSPLFTQHTETKQDKGDVSSYQDLMSNIDSLYLPNMTIKANDGSVKIINQFPLKALKESYLLKEIMIRYGGYISNEIDRKMQIDFLKDIMQQINTALSSGKYQGYQAPQVPQASPKLDPRDYIIDEVNKPPTRMQSLINDVLRRGRK